MISVIVATYGTPGWAQLGNAAMERAAEQRGQHEVFHVHLHDGTLAEARNTGAIMADGDWLCFLDADDELAPGYLAAMQEAIDETDTAALLVPRMSWLLRGDCQIEQEPFFPNEGCWPELNECVIGTVVPRDRFLAVGGFREQTDDGTVLTMYEDWDLSLRLYQSGSRLVQVPSAVYMASQRIDGRNQGREAPMVYAAVWRDFQERQHASQNFG